MAIETIELLGLVNMLGHRVALLEGGMLAMEKALQASRDELQLHTPNGREDALARAFMETRSHAIPLERQIAELLAEYRVELGA